MSSFDDWIGRDIPESVMEDAAAWMALLDSDACRPVDEITFAQWLGEDRLHQLAFEELSEVWARLRVLPDPHAAGRSPRIIPFPHAERMRAESSRAPAARSDWSAMLVSLVVLAGALIHFLTGPPVEVHETGVGQLQRVALADGSAIEMNSKTRLEIQLDEKQRSVRLVEGEAYFDVASSAMPFVVATELANLTVVGTEFAVRADASLVEVSVVEGLVSVAARSSGAALTELDGSRLMRFSDEVALLGAGQKLALTREGRRFQTMSDQSLSDDLSWRRREVVFELTPLISVLAETRRYFNNSIFVGDPVLNSLRITGRFPTDDAEVLLHALESEFGIYVDRRAGSHVVLRLPPADPAR